MNADRIREILLGARGLIADENNWCEMDLARDQDGLSVMPFDSTATQWCAIGAIYAAGSDEPGGDFSEAEQAWEYLRDRGFEPDTVNDSAGHAETIDMFDRAIALLGEMSDDEWDEIERLNDRVTAESV